MLHQGPPENSCRPAVDVLFRSAADGVRRRRLAVVLTGMGQDGLRGAERVVHAGGGVLPRMKHLPLSGHASRRGRSRIGQPNASATSIPQELLRAVALGRRTTVAC